MYCPYCGTEISEDAKFCKNCGKPIKVNKDKSTTIEEEEENQKTDNDKSIEKEENHLDFRINIDSLERYIDKKLMITEDRLTESEFNDFTKTWIDRALYSIYKNLYLVKESLFDQKGNTSIGGIGFKPFFTNLNIRRIKALRDISIVFFLTYFNISNSEILKSLGEDYSENFGNDVMNFFKFDDDLKNFYSEYSSTVKKHIDNKTDAPFFLEYSKFIDLAFKPQEDILKKDPLVNLYFKEAILGNSYLFFVDLFKSE